MASRVSWYLVVAVSLTKIGVALPSMLASALPNDPPPFPASVNLVTLMTFAAVALFLIAGSRHDARAAWLGGAFLTFATTFGDRFLARLSGLPYSAAESASEFLIALRPEAFIPAFLWLFARAFPSVSVVGRGSHLSRVAIPVTMATGAALAVSTLAAAFFRASGDAIPPGLQLLDVQAPGNVYWPVLIVLAATALVFILSKQRIAPSAERRRARLFVAGLVAGWTPILVDMLLETAIPAFGVWASQHRWLTGVVVYPPLLSIPFVTAYAVLVEHALDVRLVVRRALQYALLRGATRALLGVPFAGAFIYLYTNRDSTLEGLLSGGGLIMLVVTTAAAAVVARRAPALFDAIDRRFFREQYDARRILGGLIDRSRGVRTHEELATLLGERLDHALHVRGATLYVADAATRTFVTSGVRGRSLPRDAALAVLLGGSPEPLDITDSDPALRRLPEAEAQWLADRDARLLVPLLDSDAGLIGIIALGEKRSELPFSSDDRGLLRDVATSAALALENMLMRHSPPAAAGGRSVAVSAGTDDTGYAEECTTCGVVQPVPAVACLSCGAELTLASVPRVIDGKFRIERRLGAGGMGVVYLARDVTLHRQVAIKTLPRISPEDAARLRREARAMAAVSHQNLALIYGLETWRDTPMLIVEYLDGGTLNVRLRSGAIEPADAVKLGLALVDGLGRLHSAGLLHRDVKPSNVGFAADGVPKLLDFGLVKLIGSAAERVVSSGVTRFEVAQNPGSGGDLAAPLTGTFQILGTPAYMSPEAIRGLPPESSFDLWALAVLLYETIAGQNPVACRSLFATLDRIERAEVPDLRSLAPACSESLAAFFGEALHVDAGRRPRSAREFRLRLERVRL